LGIEEARFFTAEMQMKILRDRALFSDSRSIRTRAIAELTELYGMKAMPFIFEILDLMRDDWLRAYCQKCIDKIRATR
jgi:hypothetical protein